MRDIVRERFVEFTAPLEGCVRWMYLDVKGLVTVAIGNLIDPVQYAMVLPFVHRASRQPASRDEIAREWARVKHDGSLARLGHRAAYHATELELTDDGVSMLVARKLEQNDAHLRARFSEWEEWPACAQLAIHSLAWACGPGFGYPLLCAALRSRDWLLAATEVGMSEEGNPGLRPRNRANATLLRNAAIVAGAHLDPDTLVWDRDLDLSPLADTLPVLPVEPPSAPIVHAMPDTVSGAQRRDE